MSTIIDTYYNDHIELTAFLSTAKEDSFKVDADRNFTKILLLASASYFEDIIVNLIMDYTSGITKNDEILTEFVKRKGLSRQYHTLFAWKENNANQFFGYFGDTLKIKFKADKKSDGLLKQGEENFMLIGQIRNTLVHTNYIKFPVDYTPEEVYEKFKSAMIFVDYLKSSFPSTL